MEKNIKLQKSERGTVRNKQKPDNSWPLLKDQCYSTYSCGKKCIPLTAKSIFGKILVLPVIVTNEFKNPMSHFLIIQILGYFCLWINQQNG